MKTSPFQFLHAYEQEDINKFHGRDVAIKKLYDLLFRSNLIILFGPSGSGKTSLIDCGLHKKLDPYEWIPILIRRNTNFNDSLVQELRKVLDNGTEEDNPLRLVELINEEYIITPCLIFDQFEELFLIEETDLEMRSVQKNSDQVNEKEKLIETIDALTRLNCKIIISVREEFLAHFDGFERKIPNILSYKLRLADPRDEFIHEILKKSFYQFNINQVYVPVSSSHTKKGAIDEEVQLERRELIMKALKGGRENSKIHLPFLQVYLDRLYIRDFTETYGDDLDNSSIEDLREYPLEFEEEEIERFGDIRKVLLDFIDDINEELIDEHDDLNYTSHKDALIKFLRIFTFRKGFKRPVKGTLENGEYSITDHHIKNEIRDELWEQDSPSMDKTVGAIIRRLMEVRLLKDNGKGFFELSHDLLAQVIYEKQIDEDLIYFLKEEFDYSFQSYENGGKLEKYLLGKNQVAKFEDYIQNQKIIVESDDRKEEKWHFWGKSKENVNKEKENARQVQRDADMKEVKLETQKKRTRRLWFFAFFLALLAGLAIWLALLARAETNRADGLAIEAKAERKKAEDAKHYAESQKDSADFSRKIAIVQRDSAKIERQVAIVQRDSANIARQDALIQRDSANIARQQAEIDRKRATDAENKAKLERDFAQKAKRKAEDEETKALRQKEIADSLKFYALASVSSFASKVEKDPFFKSYLALKAFYLNKHYNSNQWNATLTEALHYANNLPDEQVFQLKGNVQILDFIHARGRTVILTDRGNLRTKGDTINSKSISHIDNFFQYQHGTMRLDSGNILVLQDQRNTLYKFDFTSLDFLSKEKTTIVDEIYIENKDFKLLPKELTMKNSNTSHKFDHDDKVTTYSLSTNGLYLAVGFQNGQLLVADKWNIIYNGQYHDKGSNISSIDFDENEEYIVTGGLDGNVQINLIQDILRKRPMQIQLENWVRSVRFEEGKKVIIAHNGRLEQFSYDHNWIADKLCKDIYQRWESSSSLVRERFRKDEITSIPKDSDVRTSLSRCLKSPNE